MGFDLGRQNPAEWQQIHDYVKAVLDDPDFELDTPLDYYWIDSNDNGYLDGNEQLIYCSRGYSREKLINLTNYCWPNRELAAGGHTITINFHDFVEATDTLADDAYFADTAASGGTVGNFDEGDAVWTTNAPNDPERIQAMLLKTLITSGEFTDGADWQRWIPVIQVYYWMVRAIPPISIIHQLPEGLLPTPVLYII